MSVCFGLFSHFKSFPLLQSHTNIYDAKDFTQQNYLSIVYDCRTSAAPGFSQGYHVCQDHKQLNLLIPANSSSPELFTSPNGYFETSGRIAGMAAVEWWNPRVISPEFWATLSKPTFPLQAVSPPCQHCSGWGWQSCRAPATFCCGNQVPQAGRVLALLSVTDAGANDDPVTNSNHLTVVYFPF